MATGFDSEQRGLLIRRTVLQAIALLVVAAAVWLGFLLRNVLFMVFVAFFLAIALEPPVHYLTKRGWRRGAATGVVFLAVLLMTVLFFWALAPLFVEQIGDLVEAVPGYIESVITWLGDTFGFDFSDLNLDDAGQDLANALGSVSGFLVGGIVGLTSAIGGFLIFATTVALFAFYMIAELPQLQRTVLSLMPESQQHRALHIWDVSVEKMGGYIYSRLVLAIVSAAMATLFLSLLEVPFALSLGIWVGVLSQFVPVVGTYLAAILPSVVAFSSRGTTTMLWVILFFVAYQQVENYVFSPRITKRTMEIHPAVSVAAIFIGGSLMGGIGVILALPVTGIVQAIISESRKHYEVVTDAPEGREAKPSE
ncbi:MAG: AI-2E family transporter [Actinomycetota bacterium]|nr:AI-2E family transporter [Actinomycetota bacterium]